MRKINLRTIRLTFYFFFFFHIFSILVFFKLWLFVRIILKLIFKWKINFFIFILSFNLRNLFNFDLFFLYLTLFINNFLKFLYQEIFNLKFLFTWMLFTFIKYQRFVSILHHMLCSCIWQLFHSWWPFLSSLLDWV